MLVKDVSLKLLENRGIEGKRAGYPLNHTNCWPRNVNAPYTQLGGKDLEREFSEPFRTITIHKPKQNRTLSDKANRKTLKIDYIHG
jgi:hypothetical protein